MDPNRTFTAVSLSNRDFRRGMPDGFQTPSDPTPPGLTYIRTFVGQGALFEPYKETSFRDVTDGVSNTLAVAVAEQPVEWTRPDELPYLEGQALPSLRRSDPRGWLIGTADAKVRNIQPDNDFLRRIITRAGGEAITWPPVTSGQILPTPPPTPPIPEVDTPKPLQPQLARPETASPLNPEPAPPGTTTRSVKLSSSQPTSAESSATASRSKQSTPATSSGFPR